jgi:hypothetical protein
MHTTIIVRHTQLSQRLDYRLQNRFVVVIGQSQNHAPNPVDDISSGGFKLQLRDSFPKPGDVLVVRLFHDHSREGLVMHAQ